MLPGVHGCTGRVLRDLLRRTFGAPQVPPPQDEEPPSSGDPAVAATGPARAGPMLVDASTWTFWSQGANAAQTLVEASPPTAGAPPVSRRVAELISAQEAAAARPVVTSPQSDPGQCEVLFTELMRQRRFDRAYLLLAPECQQSWGSPEAFAAAQSSAGVEAMAGVEVRRTRRLHGWHDADAGCTHDEVAELLVEYIVTVGDRTVAVPRTVHLVAVRGKWRSLCYPAASGERDAAGAA